MRITHLGRGFICKQKVNLQGANPVPQEGSQSTCQKKFFINACNISEVAKNDAPNYHKASGQDKGGNEAY